MLKVYFPDKSVRSLDVCIYQYKSYFRAMYFDTDIWSESEIRGYYEQEAEKRRDEIIQRIIGKLSRDMCIVTNLVIV